MLTPCRGLACRWGASTSHHPSESFTIKRFVRKARLRFDVETLREEATEMRRARPTLSKPAAVGSTPGEMLIDLGTALVAFGDALKLVGARLPANQIAPAVSAQIPAPAPNAAGSSGLPVEGFVRIWDILGRGAARGRSATLGVIPVCRATWYAGIKSGRFPKPIKHGGIAMWRVEEIRALIAQLRR